MRFDDRLQTLLEAPVADPRDRAVRWRQLVDLLSRLDAAEGGDAVDRALELVKSEAFSIDEQVRAATVRGIAGRRLPKRLLRVFAAQPLRIAAPLFAGLSLRHDEAEEILSEADAEVRALVAVAPPPAPVAPPELPPEPAEPLPTEPAQPSISDMVTRIERLKHQRVGTAPPPPAPRMSPPPSPSGEARLFQWESDASGTIAWVEGAPRGAFVGRPLGGEGVGLLERQAASRIGQRHPFVDVPLAVGDALDGQWSATGVPAFDPGNGRFLGYRGLARRTDGVPPASTGAGEAKETDLDALREMVHEIKTPLNAIIGFAEIIDGQYLGPAHRRYRERAAQIVGQARQLLDAVEDLDFAAKLRADRHRGGGGGTRLADLFPPIADELQRCLEKGGGLLDLAIDDERHRCALSPALAERLVRRLLLSLCQHVGIDEPFRITVSCAAGMALVMVARPRALEGLDEARLVDPAFDPGDDDGHAVGLGFALRLVRGLVKIAGGDLVIDQHRITLQLPALD